MRLSLQLLHYMNNGPGYPIRNVQYEIFGFVTGAGPYSGIGGLHWPQIAKRTTLDYVWTYQRTVYLP